ncbi:Gfo/Idh/MocA family protein [Cellulosimicrobium sp. NPDC057862]|uniref:Gfo/Idh/MocA family protein n=1 Tax=Cellulosimicrobium sp. NPDC057862 TaxID=3346266 RepID=UPI00367124D1
MSAGSNAGSATGPTADLDRRRPAGVGIVGCGAISGQYLETLPRLDGLRLVAVADLDPGRAAAVAAERGVRALTVDALVRDPEVDVVLNLTTPAAHEEVALAAVAAGKDVYGEKPLAADRAAAARVLAAADAVGVRVGCAPDTVLGTGIQTARRAVDDGLLGTPVAATATMVTAGHERWHPHPDFYYLPGGGPLLDMGPYYVTALVHLLGPVASVVGASSRARATRTIGSGPRAGEEIPVEVDTHVTGVLTHASGALSTLVMSFDAPASQAPPIEVHGTLASLQVPDPNGFDGVVRLRGVTEGAADAWRELPVSAGFRGAGRGCGLADLVATPVGVEPRASGRLALHVLDVMESLLDAAGTGARVEVGTAADRPRAVPPTTVPDERG